MHQFGEWLDVMGLFAIMAAVSIVGILYCALILLVRKVWNG